MAAIPCLRVAGGLQWRTVFAILRMFSATGERQMPGAQPARQIPRDTRLWRKISAKWRTRPNSALALAQIFRKTPSSCRLRHRVLCRTARGLIPAGVCRWRRTLAAHFENCSPPSQRQSRMAQMLANRHNFLTSCGVRRDSSPIGEQLSRRALTPCPTARCLTRSGVCRCENSSQNVSPNGEKYPLIKTGDPSDRGYEWYCAVFLFRLMLLIEM